MTATRERPTWLTALAGAARTFLRGVTHLVYPNSCRVCTHPLLPEAGSFCSSCIEKLKRDPHKRCTRCGHQVGPFVNVACGCFQCRDTSMSFDGCIHLGPYDGLLRDVVLRLKHHTGEMLSEAAGELWARERAADFAAVKLDMVIPVPLHWRKRWRRGYNQSDALALGVAAQLQLPVQHRLLKRTRNTPAQHYLASPAERRANVRGAFALRKGASVAGKVVLLVDDVMTTGATVSEAARPLRRAGASRVVVATLARAG